AQPVNDGQQVVDFTLAVVEVALAVADAAKVEAYGTQPQLAQAALHDGHDLVAQGAAVLGVRMTEHRDGRALFSGFRDVGQALDPAGRAGDEKVSGFGRKRGRVSIHEASLTVASAACAGASS